jgi:hypothetical protein
MTASRVWVVGLLFGGLGLVAGVGCSRRGAAPPGGGLSAPSAPTAPQGAFITYSRKANVITVGNGFFYRQLSLRLGAGGVGTVRLRLRSGDGELLRAPGEEFRVRVGGRDWSSLDGVVYASHETEGDAQGVQRLRLTLTPPSDVKGEEADPFRPRLEFVLVYEVFPDAPLLRKWLAVKNAGRAPLRLEEATLERLHLSAPQAAFYWAREDTLTSAALPASVSGEGGLCWLRLSVGRSAYLVGAVNETPGPLKRARMEPTGELVVGMSGEGTEVWLHPGETVVLPSVYVWAQAGADAYTATGELFGALRRQSPFAKIPASSGGVYLATSPPLEPARLSRLPPDSLVCLPYAWQTAWDSATSDAPVELFRAAETVRASGHRFGLRVPVAWLPEGGSLAKEEGWILRDGKGEPIRSVWDGLPGYQASLASEYGVVAYQSLLAICGDLNADGLLLEGSLAGPIPADARVDVSRWTLLTRLLWLMSGLRRERPKMEIGVGASAYGMEAGYDAALAPFGFLWTLAPAGESPATAPRDAASPADTFWRRAYALP